MTLQLALLEPLPAKLTGRIVSACAAVDAPLHLIGELDDLLVSPECVEAGPADWSSADLWLHREWRSFRDAVARERCLYFATDADQEIAEAPVRKNSVLIIGDAKGQLPERIRDKYPRRIYRLPAPAKGRFDLAAAATGLLSEAASVLAAASGRGRATPTAKLRYGRGRVGARTVERATAGD